MSQGSHSAVALVGLDSVTTSVDTGTSKLKIGSHKQLLVLRYLILFVVTAELMSDGRQLAWFS